jgi:hypothetical protein
MTTPSFFTLRSGASFRDADLDPRRFEFIHDGVGDRFAGFFEQQENAAP